MSQPNRVITRKCPGCTRILVQCFDDTRIRCEHCGWIGNAHDLPVTRYEVPPVNRFDHDPPLPPS